MEGKRKGRRWEREGEGREEGKDGGIKGTGAEGTGSSPVFAGCHRAGGSSWSGRGCLAKGLRQKEERGRDHGVWSTHLWVASK